MPRRIHRLLAALTVLVACLAATAGRAAPPTDTEIRAMLARRVDVQQQAVGIVLGIVTPAGARYVSYGSLAVDDHRTPDRHTVFEIASISKIFTALVLADLAARGEVSLDDSVSRYLPPARVTVPSMGEREISLFDLASHTSGLPLRPANLGSQTQLDKYASYTIAELYRGVSGFRLQRAPGAACEYSNLGYGLLGQALGQHTGRSFEAMVLEHVTGPLGLHETREALTPAMRRRQAVGHLPDLTPGIF